MDGMGISFSSSMTSMERGDQLHIRAGGGKEGGWEAVITSIPRLCRASQVPPVECAVRHVEVGIPACPAVEVRSAL